MITVSPVIFAVSSWVTESVRAGGPLVLVFVMFLENVFPPIPSELVLPLAGFMAEQGELNLVVAILASTLGSVLGAVVLYEVGRVGGRPLVLRYGRVLRVDEQRLDRADRWMDRHGTKVVFFARMVPLARSVVSVPAGTTRMGRARFLAYTTVGSAIWNSALILAGWLLGSAYEQASGVVGTLTVVAGVAAVLGVLVLWWKVQRRPGPDVLEPEPADEQDGATS
jgi:membrane protein DedA with SNARE-associated domain